jgi:cysteine sulfinate desulfinase/cysteine desulfurase-like protein
MRGIYLEYNASTPIAPEVAAVLLQTMAMRVPPHAGIRAVRFSLGRETAAEDIDAVVTMLRAIQHVETGATLLG